MIPLVFPKRANIPGGLWTTKLFGEFEEGDPAKTNFHFTGRVDVKLFGGNLRLFFADVVLVKNSMVVPESDSQEMGSKSRRIEEQKPEIVVPKLYIYLTKKKPKSRMVDVHKNGTKVVIRNNPDGLFGAFETTLGTFEVSLKDIPDALDHKGLVIVKLPTDAPITEEPIIFSTIKFQSSKKLKIKTNASLHFAEIEDTIVKTAKKKEEEKLQLEKSKIPQTVESTPKNINSQNVHTLLISLDYYRRACVKVWQAFEKAEYEKVKPYDSYFKYSFLIT